MLCCTSEFTSESPDTVEGPESIASKEDDVMGGRKNDQSDCKESDPESSSESVEE